MKPITKLQKRVVEVSKRLPKLTPTQIQWAYDNVIEHIGRRTEKGKITCTKCGHAWQGHGELISTLCDHACPHCKADLKIVTTSKRVFKGSYYMTIISKCQEFQVLRTVMINCIAKVGQLPQYTHSEVMQRWIAPDGKHCTFARLRQTMGTMYFDSWIYHTPLEIRQENDVYNRIPIGVIYHRQSLTTELKRTGYKKNLYRQKPLHLFKILLTDCRAETLIKSGYTRLLERIINSGWTKIENYWASIRIAIRNKYKITDATLWCDYIDLLRFFGKDLHNAKYICPHDFTKEHDKYVAKKAKVDTQLEIEKHLEKEDEFRLVKEKFFGLMFSDGTINIRVLESVAEIVAEGIAMHHCVGSYYTKEDSLILSASIDGKRIETIEISISQLKVIQSRGVCNQNTEYHNSIINLVNQNLQLIEERLVA